MDTGHSSWDFQAAEFQAFWRIQNSALPGNPVAAGSQGAVATALNGLAAKVGLEILQRGGSAVDAVLAGAMSQIVLGGGAVISFFGILSMVHFDASSGEVSSLNAGWNTCQNETDPLSIPGLVNAAADGVQSMLGSEPSGRTALIGGFMRGAEEAHARFGKLPFAALLEPAIVLAEHGFPISPSLAAYMEVRREDLRRLPETRAVFFKDSGEPFRLGDHFPQPRLASTLRQIARHGVDYMYTGPWAQACVEQVRREGGSMTLDDLARYRPIWSDPVLLQQGDFTIALLGSPCEGTINLIEAMNLAEAADIGRLGHWSGSSESLVRLAKCCAVVGALEYQPKDATGALFCGIDMSSSARATAEHAAQLWPILNNQPPFAFRTRGMNSDDFVAVDRWGNMASLCHSINCVIWGKTAINVGGISIGDPASYMQSLVAEVRPGDQLPNPIEAGLLLREGKAEIAWATMGVGLHFQGVQALLNLTTFEMDFEAAANAPRLLLPISHNEAQTDLQLRVVKGEFPRDVLDATGLQVKEIEPEDARFAQGLWVAVRRDPATGSLHAISPKFSNGAAAAY